MNGPISDRGGCREDLVILEFWQNHPDNNIRLVLCCFKHFPLRSVLRLSETRPQRRTPPPFCKKTKMNLEISSRQVASHPDLTLLPSGLPPSNPPATPPPPPKLKTCPAGKPQMNMDGQPSPPTSPLTHTPLQEDQQTSVTHLTVCGDYGPEREGKGFVSN